jgi:PAS domain S-box-containing protein
LKPWKFNLDLKQKGLILVSVPLIFELILLATLSILLYQSELETRRAEHARAVVWSLNSLGAAFYDSARALFAYRLTKSESFARQYRTRRQDAFEELRTLNRLAESDADEFAAAKRVTLTASTILSEMDQTSRALEGDAAVEQGLLDKRPEFEHLSAILSQEMAGLFRTERELASAKNLKALERTRNLVKLSILVGVALSILLAVALATFFNTGTTRRLSVLMDNTKRLAGRRQLNPALDGTDEIAQLDRVFREMAQQLEEAMRKLQATIENAQDVICTLDKNGRFTFSSAASSKVWGYEPEELAGMQWLELLSGDDRQAAEGQFTELVAGRERPVRELRMIRKDGTVVDIRWSAHWSDQEGTLFCVAHDVTQQKELERLKQQFMNMVTHDLRSPLTSLQLAMELLNDGLCGELPDAAQKKLMTMTRSVLWLIDLINDLLDIDKMEAGRMELSQDWQHLYQIFERAYNTVTDLAADNQVDLDFQSTELQIFGDGDRILQVLINLLGNAIKFSPAGSTVRVRVEAAADSIKVSVIDQGRGIPAKYKERIFERFQQVSVSDATVQGGTGLGLTICKAIVDAHGGTIGVESEEGKGTEIWFRLPLPERRLSKA